MMRIGSPKNLLLSSLALLLMHACVETSPSVTEESGSVDTAQIAVGPDMIRAVLRVREGGLVLSQWKNEHCVAHLFDAGEERSPVLELMQYDSAKMQFKFNDRGRLVETNEILSIDTSKYLNQSWKYDAFGTLLEQSSFYRYHFLKPDDNFIVLTSAFPWFKDSLVFVYTSQGQDRRIVGRDSIVVPLGVDLDKDRSLFGVLSEMETRTDTAGNPAVYARDFLCPCTLIRRETPVDARLFAVCRISLRAPITATPPPVTPSPPAPSACRQGTAPSAARS